MSSTTQHAGSRIAAPRAVLIRPLAIPNEHGGWGFLLEPILLGLALVPSWPGLAIAAAMVAAFFARHPLRLAARDWMLHKRYPRTRVCTLLALAYGAVAAAGLATGVVASSTATAIPFVAVLPLVVIQFVCDIRNRGRELNAEICGTISAAAAGAACVLAGNGGWRLATIVALLAVSRSIPTIVYVRSALRRSAPAAGLVAHAAALVLVAVLCVFAAAPFALLAVPLMLLLRCAVAPWRTAVSARRTGVEEVGWGLMATLLFAAALSL
jgi:hypothetical protein